MTVVNSYKKQELINKFAHIPEDYQLVSEQQEIRNQHSVTVLRYQKNGEFMLNGPRIIAIFQNDTLVSIKNLSVLPEGTLPDAAQARQLAEAVFLETNPDYARGLSFIRIEHQQREFKDENQQPHHFPVLWVKYAHRNGSYNWVTLGANGTVIEMEIDSRWDYFRGRRKTEMWDNDDWVLAREGKGPQLPSPSALA